MDAPSASSFEDSQPRESHWQPALRPDSLLPQSMPSKDLTIEVPMQDHHLGTATERSAVVQFVENEIEQQSLVTPAPDTEGENIELLRGAQRSTSFPAPSDEPWDQGENVEHTSAWEAQSIQHLTREDEISVETTPRYVPRAQSNVVAILVESKAQDQQLTAELPIEPVSDGEVTSDRFDEGVPLLGAQREAIQTVSEGSKSGEVQHNPFEIAAGDEETSFFSQLDADAVLDSQPATLHRKSTEDVFKTLDFTDKHESDSPVDFFQQLQADDNTHTADENGFTQQGEADDPWAAALKDGDDFLVEDADDLLPDSEPGSPSSFVASLKQEQVVLTDMSSGSLSHGPRSARNIYAPTQPLSTANQFVPTSHGNVGFFQPSLAPSKSFQSHLQQPPVPQRAESFADQSKGGYKSPYDLPLDISKTKKKPQVARTVSQPQKGVAPPPRSSSINVERSVQSPPDTTETSAVNSANQNVLTKGGGSSQRVSSSSSFFEELPTSTRPRPSPNAAKYVPNQTSTTSPPPPPASTFPPILAQQRVACAPSQTSISDSANSYSEYQLRPPERIDPYANVALQNTALAQQASNVRYSPAPGSSLGAPKPTPSPRYSPAPPTQLPTAPVRYASQPVPPLAPAHSPPATARYAARPNSIPPPSSVPFQPRTSSPLAYHTKPQDVQSIAMPPPPLPMQSQSTASDRTYPATAEDMSSTSVPSHSSALPQQHTLSSTTIPDFSPPKRSHTQSPGRQAGPRPVFPHLTQNSLDRPASAHGSTSAPFKTSPYTPTQPLNSFSQSQAHAVDFLPPSNGSENDPLERWKGAPIFTFGFGGQTVTNFPTRTPRFSSGLLKPQIKAGPGDVSTRKFQDISPVPEHVLTFPGPLRIKSKKKDVLTWVTTYITRLEAASPSFLGVSQILPDPRKRLEEKLILWKLVKVLVEFDGHFDNPEALKVINVILAPEIHAIDDPTATQSFESQDSNAVYRPRGASARLESLNPVAIGNIRKLLLKGDRKDAVWLAVDNRLWSHALLIASTLEQAVWKQVVQEFVRQEVKSAGSNTESLAALYEVFGGNVEDSIDQLVPPSARAGLQMVSTVQSTTPVKNALDGLDKWKETLALILNNRSRDDQTALLTLARLLADYGRVEAAHICFLFAKHPGLPTIFGGLDDPQASIVLLGADQRNRPEEIRQDVDAILLTEIYEFATCTLMGASAASPLPHLAPYKLERAKLLADYGHKTEAQAYCDAVAAGLKATTKVSPYYHPLLLTELDELSNRLKQVPVQGSSWMSKPSIEKVSGSIFSKFTNFVAGDDSETASQGSAKDIGNPDIGPFANVSGSPNLSRSGSQSDLYSPYSAMTATAPSTMAGSRYAPNGVLSARSSSEFVRGRPSIDSQRSPPGTSYGNDPRQTIYSPMGVSSQTQSPARNNNGFQPLGTSPGQQYGSSPGHSHYQATPPQSSYGFNSTSLQPSIEEEQQTSGHMSTLAAPSQTPYMSDQTEVNGQFKTTEHNTFGGYLAPQNQFSSSFSADDPAAQEPEPIQSYGYEPPADSGYVPYQPDPDSGDEGQQQKPKKKAFMDEDTDEFSSYSQPVQQNSTISNDTVRRKANDDAANAAFLAAAEADAQRAKEATAAKRSSGWFGGWLGGAKKTDAALDTRPSTVDAKVHQVKLGESKMKLYYDKDLKKWVNPDDPDAAKGKSATPPPPRVGGTPAPSRSASSTMPPPVLSRSSTPASATGPPPSSSDGLAATLPPNVNASLGLSRGTAASPTGPPAPGGSLPTPIRTPTSAVSTNAIDDLLGPPTGARKVSGKSGKKARGGRYVDIMAK